MKYLRSIAAAICIVTMGGCVGYAPGPVYSNYSAPMATPYLSRTMEVPSGDGGYHYGNPRAYRDYGPYRHHDY